MTGPGGTAGPGRLAGLVRAAPGSLVLPERPQGARVTVPTPLRLLDALPLTEKLAVAVVADAAGCRWTVPVVTGPAGLRRARPGDGVAAALASALGSLAATPASAFAATAWHCQPVAGERAITGDQTNESVIAGEAAVVKWAVRLPAEGDPEQPTPGRLLTLGNAGFPHTPRPWGLLRWRSGHGQPALATVTAYLPGALDGWDWAVADVRALRRGERTLADAAAPAGTLGALTASLHLTLATAGTGTAGRADAGRWWRQATGDLAEAITAGGRESGHLAQRAGALRAAFAALRESAGTPVLDVHGDLHVGQVLRFLDPAGGHAYAVTDFDGNPVLPPADRVRRAPAALDVAGMLASLDHVGRIVLHHDGDAAATLVREWIGAAQRGFLAGYRARLARGGQRCLLDERLLWPLRLHQEVREHLYAVRHLPHWRYAPDAALLDLLPAPGGAAGPAPGSAAGPAPGGAAEPAPGGAAGPAPGGAAAGMA